MNYQKPDKLDFFYRLYGDSIREAFYTDEFRKSARIYLKRGAAITRLSKLLRMFFSLHGRMTDDLATWNMWKSVHQPTIILGKTRKIVQNGKIKKMKKTTIKAKR